MRDELVSHVITRHECCRELCFVRRRPGECIAHLELLLLYLLNDHRTRSLEQAEGLVDAWLADPRNGRIAGIFA